MRIISVQSLTGQKRGKINESVLHVCIGKPSKGMETRSFKNDSTVNILFLVDIEKFFFHSSPYYVCQVL